MWRTIIVATALFVSAGLAKADGIFLSGADYDFAIAPTPVPSDVYLVFDASPNWPSLPNCVPGVSSPATCNAYWYASVEVAFLDSNNDPISTPFSMYLQDGCEPAHCNVSGSMPYDDPYAILPVPVDATTLVLDTGFSSSGAWSYMTGIDANFYAVGEYTDSFLQFTEVTITPLPSTLPLFAAGLGALGLLGWWRKRSAREITIGAIRVA